MGLAETCRVCLCGPDRRRLHPINNTLLQEMWEKLTSAKFNTNDGKSNLVCYACCAQLRKADQLMKRASEAEKLLTAIVNNGSGQSQDALLLIARQTFGFNYKHIIEHLYRLDCKPPERNTVEKIKKENEGESEETSIDNIEWHVINIKEEKEDSSQEDDVDNADVESGTPPEDDTILKQILEREVRIVLQRIDIGASASKPSLNKAPPRAKRVKLDETTKDRTSLANAVLESLPKDNSKAQNYKSLSKNSSEDSNVKISKIKQNLKSVVNCNQVNDISPKVNNLPKQNTEKEIFNQCLPKSADVIAASTSFDTSNERKGSSVCNKKTSENGYFCHICHYKCVTKSELNTHLHKHIVEKPYSCDLCDYRFARKRHLENHTKYKHTKEKNFSCPTCHHGFVTKFELNAHLRKHTGEKPYTCDLCDYRFSHKGHLKNHMKYKHTKETNYSCPTCQYKCVTKYHFNRHLRVHTGEKPYICDLCDYKSSRRSSLEKHIKCKHTTKKELTCHVCQYKCVTKIEFNLHLLEHTDKKPYICDLCGYRCTQRGTLVQYAYEA